MYIQKVGRIRPKVFIKKVGDNRVQGMCPPDRVK